MFSATRVTLLMLHLIRDKRLTEKDLDELRRAIRKKGGAS
jgi:hypothetical protein